MDTRKPGRTVWSALLLLLLVTGALDWHRRGERHADAFGAAAWSSRATTVSHGGRTPHFCAADVVVQRPCAACIYRLQTSGAHLLGAALPAAVGGHGFVQIAEPSLAGFLLLSPRLARGPPAG
jgi:hypothetical protein